MLIAPLALAVALAASHLDRYGDPLPDGAVARLGSTRFRHAGLSDFVPLPGGATDVTAGSDRVLRHWDLATGRQVKAVPLDGKSGPGQAITLSPDAKWLLAHDAGRLVVWDAGTGREVKSIPGPERDVAFLYFSPDGSAIVAGSWDKKVAVYDWRAGTSRPVPLPVRQIGVDSTFHAHFSPDGRTLVAGGGSGEPLCVFDAADLTERYRLTCDALVSAVSPDNKRLAVACMIQGGKGSTLRLFDLATGKEQDSLGLPGSYFSLAFSPDGTRLACGASDDARVVDLAAGKVAHRLTGRPWGVAYTPDGKTLLASSGGGNRLRLWDADGQERQSRPGDVGASSMTLALATSPDGRLLASGDWIAREVSLWDLTDGRLVRQFPLAGMGEGRYVRDLWFSDDGTALWAGQGMGFVQSWDVATGAAGRGFQLSDPQNLNRPYYYRIWGLSGGRLVTVERVHSRPEGSRLVAWDAAGRPAAERAIPGERRVWAWAGGGAVVPLDDGLTAVDVATGRTRFQVPGATAGGPVVTSPDGRLVAAGRDAQVVGVWEAASGKEVASVAAGKPAHLAVAGRKLVVVDGATLRVWDLATGRELGQRPLPAGGAHGLVAVPGGRRAVTALADGTALVWDLGAFPAARLSATAGEREVAGWWADLAADDPAKAYAAAWRLADAPPGVVVPALAGHLKPATLDADEVKRLVARLNADAFADRQAATRGLERLGPGAVPALRAALAKEESDEARQRLEGLIARLSAPVATPDGLRRLRAVGVLEAVGTADAAKVLAELAGGPVHPDEAREAKAALDRLTGLAGRR